MTSRPAARYIHLLLFITGVFCSLPLMAHENPQDSLINLLKDTNDPGKQCEIYVHLADLCNGEEKSLIYWEEALKRALVTQNEDVVELSFDYLIFNNYWFGNEKEAERFVQMAEEKLSEKRGALFFAYMRTYQTWLKLEKDDINEILHESLDHLRDRERHLTKEEQIEWEFLTALSIDCGMVSNGVYQEMSVVIPYVEQAVSLLSADALEQRYPFELLCYRKLANLHMASGNTVQAAATIEKIMELHSREKAGQEECFGFDRIYYNDDSFYYEEYSRLLFLPDLTAEQLERYFAEFMRLHKSLQYKDRTYWETVSNYYQYKKDFKTALIYNDSVITYVHENSRPIDWVTPYEERVELYKLMGDNKNALYWLERCDSLREQLRSEEIRQSMNEIRTRFNLDKLTLEKLEYNGNIKMILLIAIIVLSLCVIAWGIHQRLMVNRLKAVQDKLLKSNEEVRKQSLRAEESEKMKTAFIDSMCHEIRTPLNAINGFTDLCFSEGVDDSMRSEFQKLIQENTYRLTGLLDTMLELSKLVSSDETLASEETDIYGICMQQIEALRSRNTKKEVECIFEGTPCPCTFYSNATYFSKVIAHLLDNAIKFTEKGKVILNCMPNVEKRYMEISVADTGIGISPDKQEWVFERFTKVDAFIPGTGLGLYLCRLIINKLGGHIMIDATYEPGCRIVIELPCQSSVH